MVYKNLTSEDVGGCDVRGLQHQTAVLKLKLNPTVCSTERFLLRSSRQFAAGSQGQCNRIQLPPRLTPCTASIIYSVSATHDLFEPFGLIVQFASY